VLTECSGTGGAKRNSDRVVQVAAPVMKSTITIGKLLVASILLTLAACSPLSLINALGTDENVREVRGIAYGEGERRRLDVYAPPGAREAPVVVFFYGGSWRGGSRADYAFVGHAL